MALYSGARFRAGHQGYLLYGEQAAELVGYDDVADPTLQTSPATAVGVVSWPSRDRAENFQGLDGIGSSKQIAQNPGRREYSASIPRIRFADGTFFGYAIRDRTGLDDADKVKGLQLLLLEYGIDSAFGASDLYGYQLLDSLINTARIEYAENQPVTGTADVWPRVALPITTGQTAVIPSGQILLWHHATWSIGGTDYKPILTRASVGINNGLVREGTRMQMGVGASELKISRTAYYTGPSLETLQVSVGLRDALPASLNNIADWGTMTLYAQQPGTGAGLATFTVELDMNYLNRESQQQAEAGNQLSWSADIASIGIAVTSGVTGA